MTYGEAALIMAVCASGFLLLCLWAWHEGEAAEAEQIHRNRLLDELRRQPYRDRDEWQMDGE